MTLLDEIEPRWDVRERHQTVVRAPAERTWAELARLPANASQVVRVLMGLRSVPGRLMGRRTDGLDVERPLLQVMTGAGRFALLAERAGEEVVLGLAGRFWELAPDLVPLAGREDYQRFDLPGAARACVNFRVEPIDAHTSRLTTETRVVLFGSARWRFRLYWALIGPFSAWTRRDWLRLVRQRAEAGATRAT